MNTTCIFCRIASGDAPSTKVHSDERFIAFLDLHPVAETHILVVPRDHHDRLDDYVSEGGDSDAMMGFVVETAAKAGVAGRYRLITNVGAGAGQDVHHLHWHIVAGDSLPGFGGNE